jgi:hypothetical protein
VADEKPPPEFINALGTEYFVLQSTAGSTISESGSRVSIYLSSLASGLVALGFSSSSPRAFASLAFTVLPTMFVLGWFTIVRLIDTSVANIVSLRRMELIRAYYAALAPMAQPYFGADDPATGSTTSATAAGRSCSRWPAWSARSTACWAEPPSPCCATWPSRFRCPAPPAWEWPAG